MKANKKLSMLLLAVAVTFGPTTLVGEPSAKTEGKSLTADEIVTQANHVASRCPSVCLITRGRIAQTHYNRAVCRNISGLTKEVPSCQVAQALKTGR